MRKQLIVIIVVLILLFFFITACAPGTASYQNAKPAGFWWGLWHGALSLVSIIWHMFNPAVHMYEKNNSGAWYDFGFFLGILCIYGGGGAASCHRSKCN